MQIASITGVTSATQIRVEKSISKLFFRIVPVDLNNLAGGITLDELLTIKKVSRSTSSERNVCTSTPLSHLAVVNSYLEGSFLCRYLPDAVNVNVLANASFTVDLAYLGGVRLDSDNYLSIDLARLNPAYTYEVYGIEYLGQSGLFEDTVVYSLVSVPAGERIKQFNVSDIDLIAVERADDFSILNFIDPQLYRSTSNDLDKVQIIYTNGASANLRPDELFSINIDANDIVAYGSVPGVASNVFLPTFSSHLYMVDVEDVQTLEISKTSSTYSIDVLLINFPNQ